MQNYQAEHDMGDNIINSLLLSKDKKSCMMIEIQGCSIYTSVAYTQVFTVT